MREFTQADLLRLAKRINNPKRSYLLVNPLQAKHIPVKPSASLEMMHALGEMLVARYPEARLVVGFAETATAIGAAVAECFPPDCVYMHTTREQLPDVAEWIVFQEEHSHATEQKLVANGFLTALEKTPTVLFIEDEISTGRTLCNMICQLRSLLPEGREIKMVAASIINRMSVENERALHDAGITCEALVRIPETDYTAAVDAITVQPARDVSDDCAGITIPVWQDSSCTCADPRKSVTMGAYRESLRVIAAQTAERILPELGKASRILVLGTEECMYPALMFGVILEKRCSAEIFCHATTRSPIGISEVLDYPIKNGFHLQSLYQHTRNTFIYNLTGYDAAIIVSDAKDNAQEGLQMLSATLNASGTTAIYYLKL